MLVQLAAFAHTVRVWARRGLSASQPKIAAYGLKRVVRAVFTTRGSMRWDRTGRIWAIIRNRHDLYAELRKGGFAQLPADERVLLAVGDIYQ